MGIRFLALEQLCPLRSPQSEEQSSPCCLQVHLAVWQPVLQSHLKTWMSFFEAGKRSVCIPTMWPSTFFQSHSVGFRLSVIPFLRYIWRKTRRVWCVIVAEVGGKFFALTYFELLATFSCNSV